ncbi:hypothetical protein BKA70DRAFT_1316922 [Coprinopsis sp. MPI-PUGE-AT-0042]|nr:hypothetical protein BKA70DRAFT_1316922 [Coprinopsis sp. MPI-PUGE-AT-0042]
MQSKLWGQGTSKSPTTFQKYFKVSWKKLEQRTVNTNSYSVDVEMWKCNCGQQKYNPYHLCKHLVKAVGPIPMRSKFWQEIRRRRRMPLYVHPLIQKTSTQKRGSITDGDDTDEDSENIETRPSKRRRISAQPTRSGSRASFAALGESPTPEEVAGAEETDVEDLLGAEGSPIEIASSSCPGSDVEFDEVSQIDFA